MNCRVAIRVDASTAIGTGHVKRCLSLAESLRALGAEVRFVSRDLGLNTGELIAAAGFPLTMLVTPSGTYVPAVSDPDHAQWAGVAWKVDAGETTEALAAWSPDWVVIDHYGFDHRWHETVRQSLGCRIAVIDDLGDRVLSADMLVDHNPAPDHRAKYAASMHDVRKLLGGPSFALLAPKYRELQTVIPSQTVHSIGIFLGGVDGTNLSPIALAACREAGFQGPVEIVSTSANPHLASLRAAIAEDGNAALLIDLPDLTSFFAAHDIQIGAGGGATWERCRAGVPALVLATAANQEIVTLGLEGAEAALCLGQSETDQMPNRIARLLQEQHLRATLAANAARLVDGRGCERVALSMLADKIEARAVGMADAELVHRWRNDPATRAVSIDDSDIPLDDHMRWFETSLAAPERRRIYMGQIGLVDVGVVRFDALGSDEARQLWEVSIYLDPDLPGLGLGPPLLLAGESALVRDVTGNIRFSAQTLASNTASQAMFRRCGYRGETSFVKDAAGDSRAVVQSGD